jgi:hypothetical protein
LERRQEADHLSQPGDTGLERTRAYRYTVYDAFGQATFATQQSGRHTSSGSQFYTFWLV